MDAENDNEQLNSSSASSSNNSSSSNLLANLPMLPMLHSSIDDDHDLTADELQQQQQLHDHNIVGAAASFASGHQHHPQQQQPQPPPPPSQSQSPVPQLPDNSVFVSPLLFNNNSTPPPSSPSSSSSPPSSSHNLQFYHHQHSEHAHQQHSPTPSSHQQHALPPPPSPQLQEQIPFHYEEQDRREQQQEQLRPQENTYDESTIADTIDATAVEGAVGDIDLNRGVVSINREQQQQQQLPLSAPAQQLQLQQQQQQQHTDQLSVAGISLSLGEGVVATTSGERQQQTPPTTLPLLLPEVDENEPVEDDDGDGDEDEGEEADNGVREQEEAKPSISHSYSPHFTHSPFTHPLQHQQHHHHHHHYPTFGGCSGNFTYDITGSSSSNGANVLANMLGSGSGSNNDKQTGSGGMALGGNNIIGGGGGSASSSHHRHHHQVADRLKMLYPNVNENETPLPRCWSPHDKCLSIGLSQNNLRVHYKGVGKQHNEAAASVRTAHPIPPACGIYYFEVKIISKGKNGYMGIGLTAQQFRMNRLPGWDKQSYGYHGDDGNSFSSSGNGQSYGPTFTTGDIIGCCVNFVDNTCFYTKNGIHLGIAFRDLPTKLYPTVGLQTPGEEVDANFGQEPFKFDQMEDMMKQMRAEMKTEIYNFPMSPDQGDPTTLLHKMVSSYLLHNGYSQTAEAFARATGQTFQEDLSSIRIRQKILKLVMSGRMGQAIELTLRSYPGLLENNKNLWFMLKCRQFIEMVNGSDIEYCPTNNKLTNSITTQTQTTPPNQTSVIQSTKSYQNGKSTVTHNAQTMVTTTTTSTTTTNTAVINADNHPHQQDLKNTSTNDENCSISGDALSNSKNNTNIDYLNDVEMESNVHTTNGNTCKNGSSNFNSSLDVDEEMDIDVSPSSQKYSHGIERILEFGKELSQMGQQLEKENKMNDEDRQMLEDAFSLIAYSNPWSSPLGWQLCPTKRENVCTALNSAILESMNYPRRPPLDVCVAHANELLKVMAHASLGACAFVNIEDVFPQN